MRYNKKEGVNYLQRENLKRRGLALTRTGVDGHDLWTSQLDLPAGSDRFELPIPQAEIDANGELTNNDQNPAYK